MVDLIAFRNSSGELGLIQKNDDLIIFSVCMQNGIHTVSGEAQWNQWVQQVDGGYLSGDKENITKESLSYFLNNYAESISVNIIELYKVANPGSYYPRIARENIKFNYVTEEFLQDIRAYQNLQNALNELFNYIEPSTFNLKTYGHKIRELLILACTEVEYLLLKTLTQNGYSIKTRYSMDDYVKCKDILGLEKFEVELIQYPALKVFKPFYDWDVSKPTQTLPWYKAYNSVKHNRGDGITDANLEHVLDSMSAIHVLLESQYGKNIFQPWKRLTDDKSIYKTLKSPVWLCSEITAPILFSNGQGNWNEKRKYYDDNPLSL